MALIVLRRSSNLTFSLESGWSFIETEDWRPDLDGSWIPAVGADDSKSRVHPSMFLIECIVRRRMGVHKRCVAGPETFAIGRMDFIQL
jgi:hypothetical protein